MTDELILVPRRELLAWAKEWQAENDPGDDTDCVTPFDKYLHGTSDGVFDYTDIANRAQESTGRSIWPSTAKAVLEAARQGGGDVVAWMRRWAFDNVDVMAIPKNERPRGWNLRSVTPIKILDDDVPLYTAPPSAPVAQGGGDVCEVCDGGSGNDGPCLCGLNASPSAPVDGERLLADLETVWHSVGDDTETNAAYRRLKSALAQRPATADDEENRDAWRVLWLVLLQTGMVVVPLYDVASTDWSRCEIEQTEHPLTGAVRLRAILLDAQQGDRND